MKQESLTSSPELSDDAVEALIEASDGRWAEDIFCIDGPALMVLLRAAAAASPPLPVEPALPIPHDFISHKDAWRDAIRLCGALSDTDESRSYWQHELRAYDKAHAELAAAPSGPPVAEMRQPVAWRYRFHTDDSLAGKPNVRPWVLIDKEPQSHEDIEVEPLFASCEPLVEAPSLTDAQIKAALPPMSSFLRESLYDYEQAHVVEYVVECIRAVQAVAGVAPTRGGEHGE